MNKLIIIGNGFDRAHGLATDYNSFIKWFVTKCFKEAIDSDTNVSNHILTVNIGRTIDRYNVIQISAVEELAEMFLSGDFKLTSQGTTVALPHSLFNIKGVVKSKLLDGLLNDSRLYKWVDIENNFYEKLKNILRDKSSHGVIRRALDELNQELEDLKIQLSEYLTEASSKAVANNAFREFVEEEIDPDAILEKHFLKKENNDEVSKENEAIKPESIKFLDFNYTSLIRDLKADGDIDYIHIHGTLDNDENPLIFGYGDEIDDAYIEMEKTNINEFLKHIKSFGYFRTNNYSRLANFIASEPYIVYIWGHSCGLSDRTLLNMIFEHDNCAGIKIFYHQSEDESDNFEDITQNIARHFRNKIKMRNRVFNKTYCNILPQI